MLSPVVPWPFVICGQGFTKVYAGNHEVKTVNVADKGMKHMCIKDIAYRIAREYPGGVVALAARMDKSAAVLKNKLSPLTETHHLNIQELEMMVDFVDTDEVARYFAQQRGLICIQMPSFDGLSDGALLDLFLTLEAEKGQWSSAMMEALSDGKIDYAEFARIKKEYNEFIIAAAEVMSRIESYLAASEEKADKARGGRDD